MKINIFKIFNLHYFVTVNLCKQNHHVGDTVITEQDNHLYVLVTHKESNLKLGLCNIKMSTI